MDQNAVEKQLREQRELIDKIYVSVEKTRKYYLWTMWGTIIFFVVPLIAMVFAIPYFISSYSGLLSGSGLGL